MNSTSPASKQPDLIAVRPRPRETDKKPEQVQHIPMKPATNGSLSGHNSGVVASDGSRVASPSSESQSPAPDSASQSSSPPSSHSLASSVTSVLHSASSSASTLAVNVASLVSAGVERVEPLVSTAVTQLSDVGSASVNVVQKSIGTDSESTREDVTLEGDFKSPPNKESMEEQQ